MDNPEPPAEAPNPQENRTPSKRDNAWYILPLLGVLLVAGFLMPPSLLVLVPVVGAVGAGICAAKLKTVPAKILGFIAFTVIFSVVGVVFGIAACSLSGFK